MNISNFICEVEKRVAIWDPRDNNHHKRSIIKEKWIEISNEMNVNENELKKKWKSLRDNYRQELQKCRMKTKSGSKWVYFNDLSFLQESMTPTKLSGNLEMEMAQENNQEIDFDITKISPETISADPLYNENVSDLNEIILPLKVKKEKVLNENSLESNFLELEKEKLKLIRENNATNNNSNHNFLVSFVHHMDQMSQRQNLKCRAAITNIFCQLNDEIHTRNSSSTPTSSTSSWSENI